MSSESRVCSHCGDTFLSNRGIWPDYELDHELPECEPPPIGHYEGTAGCWVPCATNGVGCHGFHETRPVSVADETDALARLCDQYGLPHDIEALHTHLTGNASLDHAINMETIRLLNERLAEVEQVAAALESRMRDFAEGTERWMGYNDATRSIRAVLQLLLPWVRRLLSRLSL